MGVRNGEMLVKMWVFLVWTGEEMEMYNAQFRVTATNSDEGGLCTDPMYSYPESKAHGVMDVFIDSIVVLISQCLYIHQIITLDRLCKYI